MSVFGFVYSILGGDKRLIERLEKARHERNAARNGARKERHAADQEAARLKGRCSELEKAAEQYGFRERQLTANVAQLTADLERARGNYKSIAEQLHSYFAAEEAYKSQIAGLERQVAELETLKDIMSNRERLVEAGEKILSLERALDCILVELSGWFYPQLAHYDGKSMAFINVIKNPEDPLWKKVYSTVIPAKPIAFHIIQNLDGKVEKLAGEYDIVVVGGEYDVPYNAYKANIVCTPDTRFTGVLTALIKQP